jgi:hypothetical protein
MTISHVQGNHTSHEPSFTTIAIAGSAVGSGNCVVGMVTWGIIGTSAISSIKDNQGNSYTVKDVFADTDVGQNVASFVLGNITNAPTTITVTLTSSSEFGVLIWDEFSGVAALGDPSDGHSSGIQASPGTAANAVTSGSFTTTTDGDAIYGGTYVDAGSSNTPGTGFTGLTIDTGIGTLMQTEWATQATAGATAATFKASGGGDDHATFGMALKPASGGGTVLSLSARGFAASFGKAGVTGNIAVSARSSAQAKSTAGIHGITNLAARSSAAGHSRASAAFKTMLSARSMAAGRGGAAPSGRLNLAARGMAAGFGRVIPPGAAGILFLAASGFAMASGRAGITGKISLSAKGTAQAKGKAGISGRISLAAASRAASQGRAAVTGTIHAAAHGVAMAKGRAAVSGRIALAATSMAAGRATAAISGKISLAARGFAMSSGRASPVEVAQRIFLTASGFAASFGRAAIRVFRPSSRTVSTEPQIRSVLAPHQNRSVLAPAKNRTVETSIEVRSVEAPPNT